MKIFSIFPLIFAVLFNKAVPSYTMPPFESVSITPLCLGKETTIYVNKVGNATNLRVYLSNSLFDSLVIAEFNLSISSLRLKRYNNEYTKSTNEIWISYKVGRNWYSTPHITMKPISTNYRYIVDNQSMSSINDINVYTCSSDSWSTHKMNYSFINFDGIYIPDYYHKIRLEDFRISINPADYSLFTCTPSLVISNVDGVFDDISSSESVEFPLVTISDGFTYSFELKDILYVHKETLLLSKTPKEGYVPTKHIYLPRNGMQNLSKYRAYFALQNFGSDHDFFRHNFELHAVKNIIGDCRNSEYCIQRLFHD